MTDPATSAAERKPIYCGHCGVLVARCESVEGEIRHTCDATTPCPCVAETHGPYCLRAKTIRLAAEEDAEG